MKIRKIAVLDRVTLAPEPFVFDFPAEVAEYPSARPEETAARIAGADAIVTNKIVITAEHVAADPQLRLIAAATMGMNNVDTATAEAAGVTVCNIRAYDSESVAEHAFILVIALMHNLPVYQRDITADIWEQPPFSRHFGTSVRDLHGKTLTIFRHGNIGKMLAGCMRVFGMDMVFGEHKHTENVREGCISFDEAIQAVDAVSLHCSLTPQTTNMIGETELQRMKSGAVLVDCGRGGLVDEQVLVTALKYGRIGGTGFDVLTEEPPCNSSPLFKARLPNLIITSHTVRGSEEARNRLFIILLEDINRFVAGWPQNVVVQPTCSHR